MRIALVCPYAWDRPGGVQTHVGSLAAALERRGHAVSVLAPGSGRAVGGPGPAGGVVVVGRSVDLPANGSVAPISFGPGAWRGVKRALEAFGPDVVHCHEPFIPSASLVAAWRSEAPIVGTFHASAERNPLYAALRKPLAPTARRVRVRTAVSAAARAHVARYFPGDYAVIPNGVDVAVFARARPLARDGSRDILFLGRLEARKGLAVLVEAVAALDGGWGIVAAGEGPERARCAALAARLGVRLELLGHVPDADKARLYKSAVAYCAPNLGGESFGIVLLEAMAAGAPIVCSDLPGFREAAGQAAVYAAPGRRDDLARALARVVGDESERQRLRSAAQERVARFDWDRLVLEVEERYRAALER